MLFSMTVNSNICISFYHISLIKKTQYVVFLKIKPQNVSRETFFKIIVVIFLVFPPGEDTSLLIFSSFQKQQRHDKALY